MVGEEAIGAATMTTTADVAAEGAGADAGLLLTGFFANQSVMGLCCLCLSGALWLGLSVLAARSALSDSDFDDEDNTLSPVCLMFSFSTPCVVPLPAHLVLAS